jgi:hypothetical protein
VVVVVAILLVVVGVVDCCLWSLVLVVVSVLWRNSFSNSNPYFLCVLTQKLKGKL